MSTRKGMRYSMNIALNKLPNGNADCIYSGGRSPGFCASSSVGTVLMTCDVKDGEEK